MTFPKTIQKNVQRKPLCTLRGKNETSSSQPCIGRYCRACFVYLIRSREMLRWYLTNSGLTAFKQHLAYQEVGWLFLNLYPSGLEWNLLLTLRHFPLFSKNKPFANGLNKAMTTVVLLLRPSCQWARTQKFKRILSRAGFRWRKNWYPDLPFD